MVQLSSLSKQQAHDLVDRMTPAQLSAAIGLMETILHPHLAILRSPFSDEPVEDLNSANPGTLRYPLAKISAADERILSELGLQGDDTDFWPPSGQA